MYINIYIHIYIERENVQCAFVLKKTYIYLSIFKENQHVANKFCKLKASKKEHSFIFAEIKAQNFGTKRKLFLFHILLN